jgi:hypothetical protein
LLFKKLAIGFIAKGPFELSHQFIGKKRPEGDRLDVFRLH